jgi:hypothetical protein
MELLAYVVTHGHPESCEVRGCQHERVRWIVSYGADGALIATFRETEDLPADGGRRGGA